MNSSEPRDSEWRGSWQIVAGAAVGLGTALPIWNYVSSLFVTHLTGAFGWTRGELASASAASLLGALAGPFIGKLADRFGVRPVLALGFCGMAAIYVAFAFQPGSLGVYATLIVAHTMIGLACGGAIFSRAVAGWFERSRGLALGMTMTGVPASAALVSPLLQWVIGSYGWQAGYLLLAGLAVGVGLPMSMWLIRDCPRAEEATSDEGADWSTIARSKGFWLLVLSLLPVNAAGTGLMSQMAPLLTDRGLSGATTAWLLSLFAGSVLFSRLGGGWAIDRFSPRLVATVVTSVPALGCALLLFGNNSLAVAMIALILIGVQQGAEIDLVGYLLAHMFGLKNYASAYGVCVASLGISGAAGVAWFGWSFDAEQNYSTALAVSVPCFLAGAAMLACLSIKGRAHTSDDSGPGLLENRSA